MAGVRLASLHRCPCPFLLLSLALSYYSGAEEHFTHEKHGPGGNFFDLANNTGDKISPASKDEVGPNGTYSVYLYGNESIRYIRNHDPDTPLFMYLAWNVVHAPCEAPQYYIDQNQRIASSKSCSTP